MPRTGRAIRQAQALDRAADQACACGHPVGDHRPLRDVWNDEIMRYEPHPDYRPGEFHCASVGCDCVVST